MDARDQVTVVCLVLEVIKRVKYFGGEPENCAGEEGRVKRFKNGKAAGKDTVTGQIIGVVKL